MKRLIFCISLSVTGLLFSCVEKNALVDEDSMPSWLGSSIYGELENPQGKGLLTGTFNTYLRLVNDLGYAETLNRTGSKTVLPANDEAFERFFAGNEWGVTKYEDLSLSQKKLLLYSSMLDNALLTNMLSNVPSDNGVAPGRALKHASSLSVIDTVTTYPFLSALAAYPNNSNWTQFKTGVSVVCDATTPMLVHFTPEYMLNNNITTGGDRSDFSILVGGDYEEGDSYIFRNKIISSNVTCQNGYIHQVKDVIVPPGNMAQLMKKSSDLKLISRLFDRFAVPVYNAAVTNTYHDWYDAERQVGHDMSRYANPDSIYEVRYISEISQNNQQFNNNGKSKDLLTLDPGWNAYYSTNASASLNDMAAMFVPNDEVLTDYFVRGEGKSIIERYGKLPNTEENIVSNIDDIDQSVVAKLLSNMMQVSFANSVPSQFEKIVDYESGDFMELTLDQVAKSSDGNYDVRMASNGVIYVMNRVLSPNSYVAVSAPTLFNADMNIIKWMIENRVMNGGSVNPYSLGLDFYAYLLAMRANYALFLPTDDAFDFFYVDPATLNHDQPTAVHYYVNGNEQEPILSASRWAYDPATNQITDSLEFMPFAGNMDVVKSQLADLMNYCTVVLKNGETLGSNNYYKTKHGGEVLVAGSVANDFVGGTVKSGGQIDNGLTPATITRAYTQQNGHAYAINRLIQGPMQSVYKVLSTTPQFSRFFEICEGLGDEALLRWALGYSSSDNLTDDQQRELNQYRVFTDKVEKPNCLDYNVRFFNMYNYTVYVPNNDAIQEAEYNHGLPNWQEMMTIYEQDQRYDLNDPSSQRLVRNMLNAFRAFVRYHFQNTSVYADNSVESMNYTTFLLNQQDINMELQVSGGNGKINVTDASGDTKVIDVNDGSKVNIMTRDFEFDAESTEASRAISSSSFAVIHELSSPLYYNRSKNLSSGDVQ